MASGAEPMPPTGGRGDVCGPCACATPAKTTAISPTNVVARADHVPMLPAPEGQILVAIFHSGAALRKRRIRPAASNRDVVDQPCIPDFGRHQDPQRPVFD